MASSYRFIWIDTDLDPAYPGLDPGISVLCKIISQRRTDCRVKPGNDVWIPAPLKVLTHTSKSQCQPYSAASFQVSRWVLGFALRRKSRHSSRSRALLRKICSLPARYCGGQWISSAPYQAAAFIVK